MKRLIHLLSALALIGATSVQADVLVYQFRSTSKNIGEGLEFSSSTRGYIVWNLDDNHLTRISYASRGADKRYGASDGVPLVVTVSGKSDHQFTTFSGAKVSDGRYLQEFNRGLNKTLKHRTGQTTQFPRTFKGLSHSLNTSIGPRLSDNTYGIVYSPKRSIAANDAGHTEDFVVAGLRAELEAQGYVDFSLTASSSRGGSIDMMNIELTEPFTMPGKAPPAPAGTTGK